MTRFYLRHTQTFAFLTWSTQGGQELRYAFDTQKAAEEFRVAQAPAGYEVVAL